MSDITDKNKITVSYHCTETDQTMKATFSYTKATKGVCTIDSTIEFDPEIADDTQDPLGILAKLFEALAP